MRVEYTPDLAKQIDPRGNLVRVGASHITVTINPTVMDGWVEIDRRAEIDGRAGGARP